jgi:hypothetical protein
MLAAMTAALLTIAHGTRNPEAVAEAERLGAALRERLAVPVAGSWIESDLVEPAPLVAADELVQGQLRALWFRDVDLEMPQRHGRDRRARLHRLLQNLELPQREPAEADSIGRHL